MALATISLSASQRKQDIPNLPITNRNFYLGITPNPKNSHNSSFDDILKAYEEAGQIAEISMIWVKNQGIGEYALLKKNKVITGVRVYGLMPFITLNFAKIVREKGGLKYVIDAPKGIEPKLSSADFRKAWVNEAKSIAREFKPEYFSLGNEINDYFSLHPEEFPAYLSLIKDAYREIKEVSPKTKVLVVLSYNHLIENNQWEMLRQLCDKLDLIGLTTYPYKNYSSPEKLPKDYYLRLKKYVDKPIAFTEIGWSSSGINGEKTQADFLGRFLELTKGLNIEMVNWLFLHETKLEGMSRFIVSPDVTTIALKKSNGDKKEVYYLWLLLKRLRREKFPQ
ncbi:glycosyl hydrolase 53 family protein [bacterium]|nr:glycosyl hydrolase 53 family protein [bacterium]